MTTYRHLIAGSLILLSLCSMSGGMLSQAVPMGTAFTYQGQLSKNGTPVTNTCDLQFRLYDAANSGTQIGSLLTKSGITVANGIFSTVLDFGAGAFDGNARWLQIGAKCGSESSYTPLTPLQKLTPAPYALYGTFENASGVVRNTGTHITDSFVFGSPQLADDGDYTHDTRLFFHKYRGAFRAGQVGEDQWDDSNLGSYSTALGHSTLASGSYSIALGYATTASANSSFATGDSTSALGDASVALGYHTQATGDYAIVSGYWSQATGHYSTVFGMQTVASGENATALGRSTIAESYGEVAIGVYDTNYSPYSSTTWDVRDRLFVIGNGYSSSRSDALVMLKSGDTTLNASLTVNGNINYTGSLNFISDRNLKENFVEIDSHAVLTKVANLPIQIWNYTNQDDEIRHIGPVAQDFYAAFQMGEGDTTISTVDANGVALAAIQGLYQLVQEQQAQIAELKTTVAALTQQNANLAYQQVAIDVLMQRLTALEQMVQVPVAGADHRE